MKKKKTSNYWQLVLLDHPLCAVPQTQITPAGWHSLYLHTQRTGEHTGCLVKGFQPIWAPIWAQLAPAFLKVSYTPVKSELMLSSAPTSHGPSPGAEAGHLLGAEACHERLPKGCPLSFPGSPVRVLWQFLLPREQLQAAQLCQRRLPCHGRTRFAPSQREGGGTQHTAAVEEALSQPLMLPYCLGAKGWISFY